MDELLHEDVKQLRLLVESLDVRLGDLQTDVAELCDLTRLDIAIRRAFQENRRRVERLVVDAFGLTSPGQLITPSQHTTLLPGMKLLKKQRDGPINLNVGGTNLSLDARIRRAQIVAYYLLMKHDSYASSRVMQGVYGVNPKWLFPSLQKLVCQEKGFEATLNQIERRLLDAMGLAGDPVLPIPNTLVAAWNHKLECRRLRIAYRYANHAQGT